MTRCDEPDPRYVLPTRRLTETRKVRLTTGQTVHISIGTDPADPDRPREVFYSAGFQSGSQLEFQVQDACVLISLLLQHGHRPTEIVKSLAREERPDGSIAYASVIGLIAAELANYAAR
ncbi:hypothetical protein [Jannaschia aquimarina]|uniref:ribonucleoside-diphosphate reductase n=1 Tax=Jannaschia aquimarina TaxID=935700 RepID=A0A0D1CP92_9RHOB|nr:hypothetical protein [Jannaschia aquimarina]KIT16587.1 hypothetical protein jaqu_16820 [Jannaschia aquimarina]SNT41473.1 hypothetical protein SAMN05421775_11711 [Jannaschia aquimarina]